ncbi:unnamed protein product [Linum trigynum]|uniref:Uncharacterized protein n=1 Tax=Linum trigynum TaxID=586398 RepID=A0AAV2FHH5_9ROSI
MTWVHTSEGFPFKIRAQLFGVMMTFDQMVSLGLSKTRVVLDTKVKGVPNLFFAIIFGISTIGILVCLKCIKETNNQSLEEIDLLMGKKVEEVEARDQEQVVGAGIINVELVPLAEPTV